MNGGKRKATFFGTIAIILEILMLNAYHVLSRRDNRFVEIINKKTFLPRRGKTFLDFKMLINYLVKCLLIYLVLHNLVFGFGIQ